MRNYTEQEAVFMIIYHFSKRVKSDRRDSLYAVKSLGFKGQSKYIAVESFGIYFDLKKEYPIEKELIRYLSDFVKDEFVKPGLVCHCAEMVVGKSEYPEDDQRLLMHLGRQLGLSEEVINNIMHVVLSREALCN